MKKELFKNILSQIKRTPQPYKISLHLGGEPLIHPDFETFVYLVNNKLGIKPTVATNGTLLTPERSKKIKEKGDILFIITFAADKTIFENDRAGTKWGQVKENIEYALNQNIEIALHVIDNVKEVKELFGERQNLYIYPFHLHNVGGDFAEVVEDNFNYTPEKKKYYPCTHPWFGIAITWDGRVVICCHDILYTHIVGDIKKNSIEEIWNGKKR